MKKSKGFTLIELLAVIVILAIIALITVPVVINIINSSKKGAAEASAYGAIDAARLFYYQASIDSNTSEIEFTYDEGEWKYNNKKLEFSGTKPVPSGDSSSFKVNNGNVELKDIKFGAYICNKELTAEKVSCSTDGSSNTPEPSTPEPQPVTHKPTVTTVSGATHKGIVYLNPTDLTVECSESNSQIGTGSANASGCMKFYIFDDSGDSYKMILDHNITAKVAWNSANTNTEMKEVATALTNDTTGWVGNPRLITANEIATISENTTFNGNSSTYFYFGSNNTTNYSNQTATQKARQQSYAWLFDYTKECTSCGCNTSDSSTLGYWTSTPVADNSIGAWSVGRSGYLSNNNVIYADYYGVRPVITLLKSEFLS